MSDHNDRGYDAIQEASQEAYKRNVELVDALNTLGDGYALSVHERLPIIHAARILLAGQPIQWCKTHLDLTKDEGPCWTYRRRDALGDLWPGDLEPCHIAPKLLCDPPKGT